MSAAMVCERTSPKLYDDLNNSCLLVLPNREIPKRLNTRLSVKEGIEVCTVKYLRLRANKLSSRERLVNLAIDEVLS